MSNNVIKTAFSSGELSTAFNARVDLPAYRMGAALMRNFYVDYKGGTSNRPGTEFGVRARYSNKPTRLIPFEFSSLQNYILEFGDYYLRIIYDNGHVLENAKTVTGYTNAVPGVFTVPGSGFVNGDQVVVTTDTVDNPLNNQNYFVANIAGNDFELKDWNGNLVNTAGFPSFSAATMSRVYTVASPYAAADLALLKFVQSADVMTLTHPSYPPYNLSRLGVLNWAFAAITIGAAILPPAVMLAVANPSTPGTAGYAYVVTSVNDKGEESVASAPFFLDLAINIQSASGAILLSWGTVFGAVAYNVYKALINPQGSVAPGSQFGYMGTFTGTSAVDGNIVPDFTISPPIARNPFTGNNPATVTYFQQRRVFAGSLSQPQTFWMSRPGQFENFDISSPVVASDALTGTLVSRQVNQIKHMIAMPGGLIVLTSGGAWQISGGTSNAPVTPFSIVATPQAYNGCSDVAPIPVNYDIIFVQQKGTVVRDLSYDFYKNIYTGADISIFADHLFAGYSIVDWAYAEEPHKIIWVVRDDGKFLSLTYLSAQNSNPADPGSKISGWAQHWTQGRVKSIATIQEGLENAVYMVVERYLQGQSVACIERMHSRLMPYGAEDAWFVDSGLQTEQFFPAGVLTAAAADGDGVVLTSLSQVFAPDSVGKVIRTGGGIAIVTEYLTNFTVKVNFRQPITNVDPVTGYVWPQPAGTWTMDEEISVVYGLTHLEGQIVQILADGNVLAPQVVYNGRVTIDPPASKITIGLQYIAQLQTLDLDVGEPTIQGKRKKIAALTTRVDKTRGIEMGSTFATLRPYKDRNIYLAGKPIPLATEDQRLVMDPSWNVDGRICIQQSQPLPATILGVIPEIVVGDT